MGNYYETFYPPFFMERRYAYNAIAVNPYGYDRPDSAIVTDLLKRLKDLAPLDTGAVQVMSHDQIVLLRGEVSGDDVARFLARVADNVLGVRGVKNQLEVKRAGASARTPEMPAPRVDLPALEPNYPTDRELPLG